ncbi:hypothetical protein ACFE04_019784 [Oxalis oulophora]
MDSLLVFFLTSCAFYCGVTWLVPKFISWFINRRYNLETQIGKISLFYFELHDVVIKKKGFSIRIDKIGFRSSFLSSEVTKLLCLVICDVHINKDVPTSSGDIEHQMESVVRLTDISFHDQKFLLITAMFLKMESPEWLLLASATDLHLDGSLVRSARTLLFATCLAELTISLSVEVTLLAQGPFSVEKAVSPKVHDIADAYKIIQNLAPVIPKVAVIKVEKSTLTGMKTENVTNSSESLRRTNKRWTDYFSLAISMKFCNITTLMQLSSDFLLGFNNITFELDCDTVPTCETEVSCTNKLYSKLPLNLSHRIWSCNFSLDSMWADLNYDHEIVDTHLLKRCHYWGTPFYLGGAFVKLKVNSKYQLFQANLVFLVCIMIPMDEISFKSDASKLFLSLDGVKVASIIPTDYYFVCVRSHDVKNACFVLKLAKLEWESTRKRIELAEEVDFCWNTNLHLKLMRLWTDVMETYQFIFSKSNSLENDVSEKSIAVTPEVQNDFKPPSNLKISVKGRCRLGVKISSKQQILLSCAFKIAVDNNNIFSVEGFRLLKVPNSEALKTARAMSKGIVASTNTLCQLENQDRSYEHEEMRISMIQQYEDPG